MIFNNNGYTVFDGKGNITGKDGMGGYAYGGSDPYAVTALGPDNAVADILTDQTVAYTPFDKVACTLP